MISSFYHTILASIRKHHLEKDIVFISKKTPYAVALLYFFTLIYLLWTESTMLTITLVKPMIAFLLVTIIRKIFNRPRPAMTMKIEPLIDHKKGESFPSRHTVSAFSIALALYPINTVLGYIALIMALIVASTRILCGLHYISDVLAAIMISCIIAFI